MIMDIPQIATGLVHAVPADLAQAIKNNPDALAAWSDISAIARNEWICWVENAKQLDTRTKRIKRTYTELAEGKRRPCCWVGCIHRTDKAPSQWAQKVFSR